MQRYPTIKRGLSLRSVGRFCTKNGISDPELDTIVEKSVKEVY